MIKGSWSDNNNESDDVLSRNGTLLALAHYDGTV